MGQEQYDNKAASGEQSEGEYNIFRDSLMRYMGYANEVGESFRYQFPRFVVPSYMIAFGYCGLDAASAGWKEWNNTKRKQNQSMGDTGAVIAAAADTLLWQTFASVLIPGATINVIVRASRFVMRKVALSAPLNKWFPTIMGLGSIPMIIHPIDNFVDFALDNTTRKWIFDN